MSTRPPRILIVGIGDLSTRLAHLLALTLPAAEVHLASRSIERATRYANLASFSARTLGSDVRFAPLELDLPRVADTAQVVSDLDPDLVFMGASVQAARAIMDLPPDLFRALDEAQLGPWLPMHLALCHELMRAVRMSGRTPTVVNGAYPDAVGPALRTQGLAPDIGIGNVGNVVAGLRSAAARQLEVPVDRVGLRLVAHHYFSHHVHRFGEADGIPHHAVLTVDDVVAEVDAPRMFADLAGPCRRQGGKEGQQLTASSAASVVRAALAAEPALVHAPAPGGLPGGYPVLLSRTGAELALPSGTSPAAAQKINEECQVIDGISAILPDGTIEFERKNMTVMRELLGYDVASIHVDEARPAAEELAARYEEFVRRTCGSAPEVVA